MSRWTPCKTTPLPAASASTRLRGAVQRARHQFLLFGQHRLAIPSNLEYSVPQLRMMLRELETILGREITAEEWNAL
jgi:hypothetical protein